MFFLPTKSGHEFLEQVLMAQFILVYYLQKNVMLGINLFNYKILHIHYSGLTSNITHRTGNGGSSIYIFDS